MNSGQRTVIKTTTYSPRHKTPPLSVCAPKINESIDISTAGYAHKGDFCTLQKGITAPYAADTNLRVAVLDCIPKIDASIETQQLFQGVADISTYSSHTVVRLTLQQNMREHDIVTLWSAAQIKLPPKRQTTYENLIQHMQERKLTNQQ